MQPPSPLAPQPLAPRPSPEAPLAPPRPGFFGAATYPFRGLGYLFTTPASWPLAAVPVVVASLIIGALSWLSIAELPHLAGALLPDHHGRVMAVVGVALKVAFALAGVVLAIIVGGALAQPLSGPALEALVRRRERDLGLPPRPNSPFLLDVYRSARSAAIGLLALPIAFALTLVELLVPGSSVVIIPLKLIVTGVFVSWDLLDYPLSVRGLGMRQRLAFLGEHRAEVLGFGVALAVVFLVPCAQLLLLPAGVVGATQLICSLEARRAHQTSPSTSR